MNCDPAGRPHHDVAAMSGGGAFRAGRQIDDGQARARAQLEITMLDAGKGPFAVDDEDQLRLFQAGLEAE